MFAAIEARPEIAACRAVALGRRDEHAVIAALNFGQRIAENLQQILIGADDSAVHAEFDDGLGPVDGGDLAGILHAPDLLGGNLGCKFDDFDRLAVGAGDRIVGSLDPDLAAILCNALVLPGLKLAAFQPRPEIEKGGRVAITGFDEHAVMPTLYFLQRVAERPQEIVVGRNNPAVETEFDDGLEFIDGGGPGQCVLHLLVFSFEHF